MPDGLVGPGRPGRRVPARPEEPHLPAGRAARTLTVDVRIHDILTRAAAVAPDAMRRDPRRRAADLRRPRRRFQPGRAPLGGGRRRAPRPGGVVGPDRPRRPRRLLRRHEGRGGAGTDQPRIHRGRGHHRHRVPAAADRGRASDATRNRRDRSPNRSASASSSRRPRGSTARRTRHCPASAPARIRRRSSSPAGRPVSPRPRSSRTARPGCAPSRGNPRTGRPAVRAKW